VAAKLSHKATQYGRGHRDGDHCGICEYYIAGRPPHCKVTADPMTFGAMGWCNKYEKAEEAKELHRRLK
jgi:hypothetical protein